MSFHAELVGHYDGPADFTEGVHQVEVAHESGRMAYYKVKGKDGDGPEVVVHLVDNDETFVHPEVIEAITKALSLATMPIINWDGYVEATDIESFL